ncbi:HpcH/HpaI aldolase family protein [Blastococcus deserti]|uniref:HpcH/HpaI aldolase/citrate lyase family protein n=1 Tax=Blastococcus deserti TaxID=2259033 RepID=A0ABW4X841_9ACTN
MSAGYGDDIGTARPTASDLTSALARGPVLGTFQVMPGPAVTETLVFAGAEVVCLDAEHAAFDMASLEHHVRAAQSVGGTVVIRVPEVGAVLSRSLDTGAAGVVVPRVETAAQARSAVAAVRFPPLGARGLGGGRAAAYGLELADYRSRANDSLLLVLMVETRTGLDNVEEIAAVDGVDVIFAGPVDLASSLGVAVGSDVHEAAVRRILDAGLAAGRHVGILCADAAEAARYAALGARLLMVSLDAAVLARAFSQQLRETRSALTDHPENRRSEQ